MSRSKISEQELDHSNDVWRSTPLYREALTAIGANPNGPIKLSERQRMALHQYVAQRGMILPHGTEFDGAGNVNRDDRGFAESGLGKSLIAAGAIGASMFIPGVAPAVFGAFGGGGGAAAGAATTTGAGTAGTLGGVLSGAKSTYDIAKEVMEAAGAGAHGASEALANNRSARISARSEAEIVDQSRQRNRREATSQALKQAQQAAYLSSPDRGKAPGFSTYSRDLNLPPVDPAAVDALREESRRTLTTPAERFSIDDELHASGTEKALDIAGTAANVASKIPGSVWKKIGRFIFVCALFIPQVAV